MPLRKWREKHLPKFGSIMQKIYFLCWTIVLKFSSSYVFSLSCKIEWSLLNGETKRLLPIQWQGLKIVHSLISLYIPCMPKLMNLHEKTCMEIISIYFSKYFEVLAISKILLRLFTEMFLHFFIENSFVGYLCGNTGGMCVCFPLVFVFKCCTKFERLKSLNSVVL